MEPNPCNDLFNIGISIPSKVSRKANPGGTIVHINGIEFGGSEIIIIAGPVQWKPGKN